MTPPGKHAAHREGAHAMGRWPWQRRKQLKAAEARAEALLAAAEREVEVSQARLEDTRRVVEPLLEKDQVNHFSQIILDGMAQGQRRRRRPRTGPSPG